MLQNRRSAMTKILLALFAALAAVGLSVTDPNDLGILKQFRDGLENPELLEWPSSGDDPCGPPSWKHVFCSKGRVTQIQVQNMSLKGPLPQNLNKLSMLQNLGLQKNLFTGQLPSFSGLSNLQYAYLDYNQFDTIPGDFFDGLTSLQVLALDSINFNASTGWSFPKGLQDSAQLANLSCMSCNLVGPLPDFLGRMQSLQFLKLSGNSLSGEIPASFQGISLQMLWLNDQQGGGMTGPIDVVTTMASLSVLWLHGNQFTGTIPESIGNLTLLKDLDLNGNKLVGLVPDSLANMQLDALDLNNNQLMGPIPNFKAAKVTCASNAFCQSTAGVACAPQVMALIQFLGGLNYPSRFVSSWTGNNPCTGPWLGLNCDNNGNVFMINIPKFNLSGTLSPSVAQLDSLSQINLASNEVNGPIPSNWTSLKSLKTLDLSDNNISYPLPKFSSTVKLVLDGNPLLNGNQSGSTPPSGGSPSSGGSLFPPGSPVNPEGSGNSSGGSKKTYFKTSTLIAIVAPVAVVAFLAFPVYFYCYKKRKDAYQAPGSLVIHPRDPSDSDNMVKIVVPTNVNGSASTVTGSGSASRNSSAFGDSHVIEAGNLVISVQVLRNVTKNFAPENELGRGGFGVVYKGELDDGTKIAVKRMEAGVLSGKALNEFQAEIAVLSKVRHRHLVSLLGYSVEGNERILVYEYMPQGALSKHLFHWKSFELEPLSWKRRLNIALDVARGMEYLHSMAHQSFIHRDLKSSNILLGDDFKAKVSDFGLVKLAPDGEKSVVTRLAGTFGYLAPEYAVTGRITTKTDVFSFGVVLMELLTGLMALDDGRPEDRQYLAAWFWRIKSDKEKLRAAIDPALDVKGETFESMSIIAELAGHCTAREPGQRPDMGYAVNVLAPLVEKWKPLDDDTEEYCGIDYSLPLNQMVKGWQEAEGKEFSYLEDSKGSIPERPTGFAESFTSADGR
ncbi:receptor protein kinase TMK1 [Tripterygium wilfordii]|uniref:non-specific serine/threonine protein kinase n=1 Tax=Tripterygium wilfordii TaxID=458696 RepID=A0A7J7DW46_TRIWF|nr:receptor protein kinase TMK1-like [Tripterygium wilfordii]XP_038683875.1 receptor protein kinase TMK1-like [Tripterygium wilfordii]KAF5750585.1 receptor protein kinase TMK1 [Tripterygium wilfordii]